MNREVWQMPFETSVLRRLIMKKILRFLPISRRTDPLHSSRREKEVRSLFGVGGGDLLHFKSHLKFIFLKKLPSKI